MATRTWKKERASERIDTWLKNMSLKDIEIKEFVRDTDLTNLPGNVAYRLDGAHLYADVLNLSRHAPAISCGPGSQPKRARRQSFFRAGSESNRSE
jgi:hypothetical protein